MNGLEIKKIREELGLSQTNFGKKLGVGLRIVQYWEKGDREMPETAKILLKQIVKEQNELLSEQSAQIPEGNLTRKIYEGQTLVKVVSSKAQAGWSDAYYSEEYLKDMPDVLIESDENYKGNYLAFEVDGESMEPEYYAGDIVICREVQRHLWSYKLHYKDWDFVIAHGTKGIMLKEITSHNVETGEIICHSLHPSHDDFRLNLREVAHLYNVVEVRQKGRNKKRNR